MTTASQGTSSAATERPRERVAQDLPSSDTTVPSGVLLLLLLWLGVLLLAPTLGNDSKAFLSGDPLYYAAIAKSTLQSDDWALLKLGDQPYFNKPPLVFWAAMASYRVLGISTWSAELPGVLAGLGVMLGTFLLGRRLVDSRHGFIAACVLCTTYVFLRNASVLRMDAPLTLAVLLSMGAMLLARDSRAWLPLFFTGVALGVLVKGPAGLLPIPILLLWRVLRAAPLHCRDVRFWSGLVLLPLLLLPWIIHVYGVHGEHFIEAYTADVERIVNPNNHAAVLGKYARDLAFEGWPWLPFLLHGLWLAARAHWRRDRSDAWTLPTAWIVVVAVSLLMLSRAYSRYVIPMLPVTSLLVARSLLTLWPRVVGRRLVVGMSALLLAGTVLLASGQVDVTGDREPDIVSFRDALAARGLHERVDVLNARVSDRLQSAAIFYCDMRVDALPPEDVPARLAFRRESLCALRPHGVELPSAVDVEVLAVGDDFDLVALSARS